MAQTFDINKKNRISIYWTSKTSALTINYSTKKSDFD